MTTFGRWYQKGTLFGTLLPHVLLFAWSPSQHSLLLLSTITRTRRLGVFTQDLAQELDPDARAVDLVTSYARQENVFISDESARRVLGSLGLTGDKNLRRMDDLSGGEKARVALAMFAMKPSNVLLLDEPSNHLDSECVKALCDSLAEWDSKADGALVIVSHDQDFCKKLHFTHVGTVADGKWTIEPRDARDSDWGLYRTSGSATTMARAGSDTNKKKTETVVEMDPKLRKKAFNAPKRISKIEKLVEAAEREISSLEDEMVKYGRNAGKLVELTEKKEQQDAKVAELIDEWQELEELMEIAVSG